MEGGRVGMGRVGGGKGGQRWAKKGERAWTGKEETVAEGKREWEGGRWVAKGDKGESERGGRGVMGYGEKGVKLGDMGGDWVDKCRWERGGGGQTWEDGSSPDRRVITPH